MIDKICGEQGQLKETKPYHTTHAYAQWGGTQRMALCGPLRSSDKGDEHIEWFDQFDD